MLRGCTAATVCMGLTSPGWVFRIPDSGRRLPGILAGWERGQGKEPQGKHGDARLGNGCQRERQRREQGAQGWCGLYSRVKGTEYGGVRPRFLGPTLSCCWPAGRVRAVQRQNRRFPKSLLWPHDCNGLIVPIGTCLPGGLPQRVVSIHAKGRARPHALRRQSLADHRLPGCERLFLPGGFVASIWLDVAFTGSWKHCEKPLELRLLLRVAEGERPSGRTRLSGLTALRFSGFGLRICHIEWFWYRSPGCQKLANYLDRFCLLIPTRGSSPKRVKGCGIELPEGDAERILVIETVNPWRVVARVKNDNNAIAAMFPPLRPATGVVEAFHMEAAEPAGGHTPQAVGERLQFGPEAALRARN